jgi:hypothetical protein
MRRVPSSDVEVVPPVRGPAAIAMLNMRCLVVLAVVNLVPGVVLGAMSGSAYAITVVAFAVMVAVVPVAVVGFPAGVLTAHLLRHERREHVHVAVFAAVGALLAALLLLPVAGPSGWIVLGLVEGALGAGGARWWSGRAHAAYARPRLPSPEPEDALIDAQLERGLR